MTQTLSPQQILYVKLLELPTLEFEDKVRNELLDNPALEDGVNKDDTNTYDLDSVSDAEPYNDDSSNSDYNIYDDYLSVDDIPDYNLKEPVNSSFIPENIPFSESISFYELMKNQLRDLSVDDNTKYIVEYLIGSLDSDGILRKKIDVIADELNIYFGLSCEEKDVENALQILQEFDPAGVGARDLQECLSLQLRRKLRDNTHDQKYLLLALQIINDCYEEFTKKHWEKIIKKINIEKTDLDLSIAEIVKLNPKPGASLGESLGKNFQQIIPDFIVEISTDGSITLSLTNGNMPQLKMSAEFKTLIDEHQTNKANMSKESKEAMKFLKQKMEAAQWFIDAVKQRQNTLLSTMQTIINIQKEFFLEGDERYIKPMKLKDVAEQTGLDISTISRVSNSKYVQTNYGIFPLKMFFNDSITTDKGEEKSVLEIKNIISEIIDAEDKSKPLTDEELKELLNEKGYTIARRTITKYREQMNIPVARLRR